jgi:hypothetical protein
MLDKDVMMADIDADQWRNAQALVLRSAKRCRRLVVIHDAGRVVKFRHSHGRRVRGRVSFVSDPHRLARDLYETNRGLVDFVVVMERDAVDSYFAQVQDSWDIEEDLDAFVARTYATLDSYADGIVTYPGPTRETLGLQWRVGASLEEVTAAVRSHVAPRSTVILGTELDGRLSASLIIDVDSDHRITSITTADPSRVDVHGTPGELAHRLTSWVERAGRTVSFALVVDQRGARELLAAPAGEKAAILEGLQVAGRAAPRVTPS